MMKKLTDMLLVAGRIGLILLLLLALTTAGASSAARICQPVLEDDAAEAAGDSATLVPDPLSEETDADNMAGTSEPYSEQDAAQLNRWLAPNVDKPQGRRAAGVTTDGDVSVSDPQPRRGQTVIGSLAEAVPLLNHQATLVGAKPSGTM